MDDNQIRVVYISTSLNMFFFFFLNLEVEEGICWETDAKAQVELALIRHSDVSMLCMFNVDN